MAHMRFELPEGLKVLLAELLENGIKPYLVGGCVRDLLLNREPHDFDLCSSALPDDIVKFAINNKHPYNVIGIEYGTVTIFIDGIGYEITTFRKESEYNDGRHPDDVAYSKNIEEDLTRRDFTINAMAYDFENDTVIDLFNGIEDINNRIIRSVGNPYDRFSEDYIRMLRALRFAIALDFDIDKDTSAAIHSLKDKLALISKERITSEFKKTFNSNKNIHNIFMEYSDVIDVIIPGMERCKEFNQNNKYHKHNVYEHMLYVVDYCGNADFEVKLAALLHDIGKPDVYSVDAENGMYHFYGHPEKSYEICTQLLKECFRLTSNEYDRTLLLIRNHDILILPNKKHIRKALSKYGEQFVKDYIIHKQADMLDHKNIEKYIEQQDFDTFKKVLQEVIEDEEAFKITDLKVNGNDIREIAEKFEKKPTTIIGKTLNYLLDEVMTENIGNYKHELLEKAEQFIEKQYN